MRNNTNTVNPTVTQGAFARMLTKLGILATVDSVAQVDLDIAATENARKGAAVAAEGEVKPFKPASYTDNGKLVRAFNFELRGDVVPEQEGKASRVPLRHGNLFTRGSRTWIGAAPHAGMGSTGFQYGAGHVAGKGGIFLKLDGGIAMAGVFQACAAAKRGQVGDNPQLVLWVKLGEMNEADASYANDHTNATVAMEAWHIASVHDALIVFPGHPLWVPVPAGNGTLSAAEDAALAGDTNDESDPASQVDSGAFARSVARAEAMRQKKLHEQTAKAARAAALVQAAADAAAGAAPSPQAGSPDPAPAGGTVLDPMSAY